MTPRLARISERLDMSYWLLLTLCVAGAIGLSYAAQAVDSRLPQQEHAWYLFRGGPEGARSVLTAVASSMMTFASLVFSVTILVLQQASNQFSPRVLRTFLRDRRSQLALGIFVGTFVYALLTLRGVRGTAEGPGLESYVPSLSVWLAVVLVLLCVGTFIYFIPHVAQSIRAVVILDRIRQETCPPPTPSRKDEEGAVRLPCPRPDWVAYVRLVVDEARGTAPLRSHAMCHGSGPESWRDEHVLRQLV